MKWLNIIIFYFVLGKKQVLNAADFENIITNKLPFWEDYKERKL